MSLSRSSFFDSEFHQFLTSTGSLVSGIFGPDSFGGACGNGPPGPPQDRIVVSDNPATVLRTPWLSWRSAVSKFASAVFMVRLFVAAS